ncbi:DUF5689 domain-containing protein [Myroides odoratimimus]|uniref:DUF5689 domain-containing protein n=1 Tax=Myroides odoratimimus TaxID=76832 RepID=A0AAI8C448_9FLAO|nr:DUF5689 domain-containing protein [Myroides odoratimimus]ALU25706.1 hypothetical protein AS202_05965 [Myroides odoratimimus]MDM1033359.1 hypothetical protein [Myroides odoratimimus]
MKTIFKSILYISFASLLAVGCAKNDDFTTPDATHCDEPQIKANKTIEEIFKLSSTTKKAYESSTEDFISGVVVSSDEGGNFYKDLYIETIDGGIAARVKINRGGTYGLYPVGRVIHIRLNGLFTQIDNGVLAIGINDPATNYTGGITNIPKHIFRSCKTITGDDFNKTYNHVVSLKEAITDNYLGKLVTITDVQFKEKFWDKPFWDENNLVSPTNKATNVEIESKESVTANVIFRVAEQSSGFKNHKVPAKSGTMTGVMTKFSKDYQFVPRTMVDLVGLDKDPFKGNTGGSEEGSYDDPNMKLELGKYLAFPGANFDKWEDFTSVVNSYGLKHVALAEKQGWNNTNGMSIKATPSGNDFLFTLEKVKNVPTGATKLSFLVKGTAGASLVPLMYKADGKSYVAYNVGNLSVHRVVKANTTPLGNNTTPEYKGNIDTKGQWVKVVLDLTSAPEGSGYNTSGVGNFFAIKVGKEQAYDLIIDEIRFEDGTPGDGGTTEPEVPAGDLPEAKALVENFEKKFTKEDRASSYDAKELDFEIGKWYFSDSGVYSDANDLKSSGEQSIRFRGNDKAEAFLESKFVVTGLKKVEFQFGGATFKEDPDADKEIAVEFFYSIDSGKTWKLVGKKVGKRGELTTASFDIAAKATDKVSIKIQNASFVRSTKNRLRVNIDDIKFIK